MRIALCDDSIKEQKQFTEVLHGWDPTRQPECFSSGAPLLEAARRIPSFDIVFLDIYMPGENGVEIAQELKKISPETAIVFVTTSQEHAVDAFSLHALHYLVKPVTTEGVIEAFRRLSQHRLRPRTMLTLTSGRGSCSVYLDEIGYVRSDRHAKEIVLTDGRILKIWTPLEELEAKLDSSFLRVNRSTIVNMNYIEQMGTDTCVLRDGTKMEFPRRERGRIRAAYDEHIFSRLSEQTESGREAEK